MLFRLASCARCWIHSEMVSEGKRCCLRFFGGGIGWGRRADEEEVERALGMDRSIPGSSQEFVRRVSSRAYNMPRKVMQSLDSIGYDLLETNPWREDTRPVYVLTQRDNQLWIMKTRRNHSEVESELGMLFAKGGSRRSGFDSKTKQSTGTKFEMLVSLDNFCCCSIIVFTCFTITFHLSLL